MININCDLGEGLNNEHIIMPLIKSSNIGNIGKYRYSEESQY